MSELGSSAAVGIEAVEWLDAGGGTLTVRVSGRWRRRRGWIGSHSRGPTTLLIESEGRRHRFAAMPEPPSLAGAAPGTWRLSFAIPAQLAPELGARAWLSLGSVTVPLPVPESAPGVEAAAPGADASAPGAGAPPAVEPAPAAVPEPEAAPAPEPAGADPDPGSLEIERAWRRADDAERAAVELDERVAELERALQERDLLHREAEQRAHAEQMLRRELARQVADSEDLRLRAEDALRARQPPAPRVPAEPLAIALPEPAAPPSTPVREDPLPAGEVVDALRRELQARVVAEAGLRARTVQAETRLAARVLLERRTAASLVELRAELDALRAALDDERARRERAEARAAALRAEVGGARERSREAADAISALRGVLQAPGGADPEAEAGAPGEPTPSPVTPERLSDALTRLRQASEPRDPVESPEAEAVTAPPPTAAPPAAAPPVTPVAAGRPTLQPAFARLASADAALAGRLLLDLLGAQRAAYPHPVAYDLVLGPGHGCVQVTVGPDGQTVELQGAARAREQVDLQVIGDPARLARLLTAGPLRRLLRLGVARVRGRREGLAAVRALLALPLDLDALRAAGAAPRPETLLGLVAAMIDPAWTRGERFTISHTGDPGDTVYLQIRDGRPPLVTRTAPDGRVATALGGSGEELARTLSGTADATPATLGGDVGPLDQVRAWTKLAQCG